MTYEELRKAQEGVKVADIKGKNYVQVNSRVDVFRKLYPEGTITTDILSNENGVALMKATVMDAEGHILSTGLAYEKEASSYINKASYIENCETSAVGRALGFLGIGIDAAMASAEEMTNSLTAQEALKEEAEKRAQKLKAESDQLREWTDKIQAELQRTGIEEKKILERAHIQSLGQLNKDIFESLMRIFSKTPDKA